MEQGGRPWGVVFDEVEDVCEPHEGLDGEESKVGGRPMVWATSRGLGGEAGSLEVVRADVRDWEFWGAVEVVGVLG